MDENNQFEVNPFGNRYQNAHVSKIQLPPGECEKISKWIAKPSGIFMLIGNPGLGKTYVCAALYNYLIEKKINKYFIRTYSEKKFFSELHQSIDKGWDYLAVTDNIAEVPYLFLDDILTKSNPTGWQQEVLFHLLDLRYSSEKPTIITSNVWLEDIRKIMGDRFVSRLKDKKNLIMEINWIDKRLKEEEND